MKFSDIKEEEWSELKPYLDTILLPVTGLSGSENPWEATQGLEELRDLIDAAEIPFRGRVVVYPAYHYVWGASMESELQSVCNRIRMNGFAYIIVALRGEARLHNDMSYCDLALSYSDYKGLTAGEMKKDVQGQIVKLWSSKQSASNL